jgi:hypothetical protein
MSAGAGPLAALRRLRDRRLRDRRAEAGRSASAAEGEPACELCAAPAGAGHGHLVDVEGRGLLCSCRACHLLFTAPGSGGHRYRAVPDRYAAVPTGSLSPAPWEALRVPVSVAYFFANSKLDRIVAFYPGPAGATESLLPVASWDDAVASSPLLGTLEPDVEALLVRTGRDGGAEAYVVPIDACYELVGLLRTSWRGFDGGTEAHRALDAFFAQVRERCT